MLYHSKTSKGLKDFFKKVYCLNFSNYWVMNKRTSAAKYKWIPVNFVYKVGAKKKCKSRRICLCKFWSLVGVEISQQSWENLLQRLTFWSWWVEGKSCRSIWQAMRLLHKVDLVPEKKEAISHWLLKLFGEYTC